MLDKWTDSISLVIGPLNLYGINYCLMIMDKGNTVPSLYQIPTLTVIRGMVYCIMWYYWQHNQQIFQLFNFILQILSTDYRFVSNPLMDFIIRAGWLYIKTFLLF